MPARRGEVGCCLPFCGSFGLPGLEDAAQLPTAEDRSIDQSTKKNPPTGWKEVFHEEQKESNEQPMRQESTGGGERVRRVGQYELGRTLGTGMSGKVKLGIHMWSGRPVALKIVDKRNARKSLIVALKKEIKAMKTLKHPNIVRLEFVETNVQYPRKYGGTKEVLVLGLEYAEGGALCEYMVDKGAFPAPVVKALFAQIVGALAYCHAHGIYHRDIKPSNILVDRQFRIKIADFGLAALREEQGVTLVTNCGTLAYMAPELHAKKRYNGAKADVWSAGVVLFNLCTFASPFNSARKGDWYWDRIVQGKWQVYWRAVSRSFPHIEEGARHLIEQCLLHDPEARMPMEQVLLHPWLATEQAGEQEVADELSRRQAMSKDKRTKQKNKAMRRRKGGRWGSTPVGGGQEFDPFDRKVSRALAATTDPSVTTAALDASDATTASTQSSKPPSPIAAPAPSRRSRSGSFGRSAEAPVAVAEPGMGPFDFYTILSPTETLERLTQALYRIGALVEKRDRTPTGLRVSLPTTDSGVSAKVDVTEAAGPVTLVSVKSRGGSIIEFNQLLYLPVKAEMRDIIPDDCDEEGEEGGEDSKRTQPPVYVYSQRSSSSLASLDDDAPPLLRGGSQVESILPDGQEEHGMI